MLCSKSRNVLLKKQKRYKFTQISLIRYMVRGQALT